jgi:DNA-binding winged helix-turn-helix (wHTH) protein
LVAAFFPCKLLTRLLLRNVLWQRIFYVKQDGTSTVIRFGTFEANLRSGELRKHGTKLKLGDQPFSVLAILLAQPGDVVTREDLQKQLWPTDTFVDFDRGLNKAINRLRDALGDSADAPRFIETLPKRGYRFIGTIETAGILNPPTTSPPYAAEIQPPTIKVPDKRRGAARTRNAIMSAGILLIASIAVWWFMQVSRKPAEAGPVTRSSLLPPSHTTFVPYSFALSPTGTYLAFIAEATDGSRSLWIRTMSTANSTMIAGTAGASFPFWSPDERHVGFFADRKLKIVEIAGGAIHVLADVQRASGGTWGNSQGSLSSRLMSTVRSIRLPTLAGRQVKSVPSPNPTVYEAIVGLCFCRMAAIFFMSPLPRVCRLATSARFAWAHLTRPMTRRSRLKTFEPLRSLTIIFSLFETACSTPSGSIARNYVPPANRYR